MRPLPPIIPTLSLTLANAANCLAQLVVVTLSQRLWPINALIVIVSASYVVISTRFMLPKIYRDRAICRADNWRDWLNSPVPALAPQTPWSEIERAVTALVEKGVDPTYERAEDWLRAERGQQLIQAQIESEMKMQMDLQERMATLADKFAPEMSIAEWNYNGALWDRVVRCKHESVERVLDGVGGTVAYFCSDCGRMKSSTNTSEEALYELFGEDESPFERPDIEVRGASARSQRRRRAPGSPR
jgi:hypothetical protein